MNFSMKMKVINNEKKNRKNVVIFINILKMQQLKHSHTFKYSKIVH